MKKIPNDLDVLAQKISELEQKEAKLRHETKKSEFGRASGLGLRIGAELLSAVIVGAAIGGVADKLCGTKPFLMAVFLIFGGVAGILNVYRLSKREDLDQ